MVKNTNAKSEFINHTQSVLRGNSNAKLLCYQITFGDDYEEEEEKTFNLTTGFTKEEYD